MYRCNKKLDQYAMGMPSELGSEDKDSDATVYENHFVGYHFDDDDDALSTPPLF